MADGGHFWIDEKQRTVEMTEIGYETVEDELIRMGLLAEGELVLISELELGSSCVRSDSCSLFISA